MLKSLKIGLLLGSLFSTTAIAAEQLEGEMIEQAGRYYVKSAQATTKLNVVNNVYLRDYTGQKIIVKGEMLNESMDAHVVSVKLAGGEKVVYDWEQLNEDLYEN